MRVIDLTDMSLADLRIKALDRAVAICGPWTTSNPLTLEKHQTAVIDAARLFYLFLCEEDEKLTQAMRASLK